ncbi:hypothetical protein ACUY3N_01415 [Corynebacterium tuberculostearicum]
MTTNKDDASTSAAADSQFQQADANSGSGSSKDDADDEDEDSSPVTVTKTKDAPAPAPAQAASSGSSNGHSWSDFTSYYAATSKTSSGFASNVYTAFMNNWVAGGGTGTTLSVYSPATGGTYTMYCSGSSSRVSCSGGDNARVVIY